MFKRKKKKVVSGYISRLDQYRMFYQHCAYKAYAPLEEKEMKPKLDSYLKDLFNGDIDCSNGDVLDRIIFSVVRAGLISLEMQRAEHISSDKRTNAGREVGGADFAAIRNARAEELVKFNKEYEKLEKMIAEVGEEV